jgi:hypothetical protein
MRMLPIRDYVAALLLIVFFTIFFKLYLENPALTQWDSDHPLVGGVVAGFIVLIAGLVVVDTVRAHLNNKKWDAISRLSLLTLSREITIVIDTFLWLGSGRVPDSPIGIEASDKRKVVQLRRKHCLKTSRDSDYGNLQYADYHSDVMILVRDEAWCRLAELEVSRRKDAHRQNIAALLPAMFLTSDARGILERTVAINHWLSVIQSHLNFLASDMRRKQPDNSSPKPAADVSEDWMRFLAEAMSLREDLWAISRPYNTAWEDNRNVLPPNYRRELAQRQQSGVPLGESSARRRSTAARPLAKTAMSIR